MEVAHASTLECMASGMMTGTQRTPRDECGGCPFRAVPTELVPEPGTLIGGFAAALAGAALAWRRCAGLRA